MSGIYGTREVPARLTARSQSSPLHDTTPIKNGLSPDSRKNSKSDLAALAETAKIPYKAGVHIERRRVTSGGTAGDESDDDEGNSRKEKNSKQRCDFHETSVSSSAEDLLIEKEITDRNYNLLMQQLAAALVEKETLAYQVQILGQAYGELKDQLTSLAEKDNSHPSRLECLQNERCRLADYIVSLSATDATSLPKQSSASPAAMFRTQRDLWKNKFLANSLIVDQLNNQRLFLFRQFEEAQQVLTGLLDEKEKFRKGLLDLFSYLRETKETLDPLDHGKYRHLMKAHTVDSLLEADQELAEALHRRLLNRTKAPPSGLFGNGVDDSSEPTVLPSQVEIQARKISSIDAKAFSSSNPSEDFQHLINERAKQSGLPPPKMHNIVVNCCKRCAGQIKIV